MSGAYARVNVENQELRRQLAEMKALAEVRLEQITKRDNRAYALEVEVNQLRAELQEAKKGPAIPEKWQKAIEPLADWEFIGTAHHDRIGYAINELGNACISESATTMHVRHATQQLLHWLQESPAAELEKPEAKR
jgi:hypothetical protein